MTRAWFGPLLAAVLAAGACGGDERTADASIELDAATSHDAGADAGSCEACSGAPGECGFFLCECGGEGEIQCVEGCCEPVECPPCP